MSEVDTRNTARALPWLRRLAGALLVVHSLLLAWGAWRHSPTVDEVGHFAAGLSHWHLGRFDLYSVNPPLVRMVASVPVALANPATDWRGLTGPEHRPEWKIGKRLIEMNGERSIWLFTLARWACIPFSVLGGYVCLRWANELYGPTAGILALSLWCFSPTVIGHGQLITTDVGAASLGVAAAYVYWRWFRAPSYARAVAAGVVLGLAELAKTTWIVLFVLWPALWLVCRWSERWGLPSREWRRQGIQLTIVLSLGAYLINVGYCFEGSFRRLGDYAFVSDALTGQVQSTTWTGTVGNRFSGGCLSAVRVPLPSSYVIGIDSQKREFEMRQWSYLRGEWRKGGWWYYYLYALAIKVPLGTWALMVLALLVGICRPRHGAFRRENVILVAPIVVVLAFVSSQTGFNHHLRYVLPIFPFAFVWASSVVQGANLKHFGIAWIAGAALLWSIASSLCVYPHSLSYFNALAGGPSGGYGHLNYSNIDWGQDLFYLKRWADEHPEAHPLGLAYWPPGTVAPRLAGLECALPPGGQNVEGDAGQNLLEGTGPLPGWYAVSVNELVDRDRRYAYFFHFRPVAMAGFSIHIYHITQEEANRARQELGLPELAHPKLQDEGAEQ